MMETTKTSERSDLDVRHRAGPLAGVMVLTVSLTTVVTFCVVGDIVENGMTLSQEEISLSCPMPGSVRFSLPDLSKGGDAAWI
jgi:hypothetical protein